MLTAVVLAKNEEENLPRCLQAVGFCDQVVVVDDDSSDNTRQKALALGARVFSHSLQGDFATQRNWILAQIRSHWVLFVDADEVVSAKLADEIKKAIKKVDHKGFLIPRWDYLWGKKLRHGDAGGTWLLRLARRGAGRWQGRVHETWQVEGRKGSLKHPIFHYSHPAVSDFLRHLNQYSSLRAQELFASGRRSNLLQIVFYPVFKFLYLYLFSRGFLDGTPGFISAMMMAFYSFLVRGKLYLLNRGIGER